MPEKYTEFKPVIQQGDTLVYVDESNFSSAFPKHIEKVLQFYQEDFKLSEQGKILIPERLYKDKELLWNYTTKANDPNWIKQHAKY